MKLISEYLFGCTRSFKIKQRTLPHQTTHWSTFVVGTLIAFSALIPGAVINSESKPDGSVPSVEISPTHRLVRYAGSPTVYLIESGTKRPIPTPATLRNRFGNLPIAVIPDTVTYPDGNLITFGPGAVLKTSSESIVWLIVDDGSRYAFRSSEEFSGRGYRFDLVEAITTEELAMYPISDISQPSHHPRGTLIQYQNSPTVYRIENSTKRAIPSPAVFFAYADSWIRVLVVPSDLAYEDGRDITFPDGYLIKGTAPTVYLIEQGDKRAFRSAEAFLEQGYSFSQIVSTADEEIGLLTNGSEIGSVSATEPPSAPTGLKVVQQAANQIVLSWNPVPGAAAYTLKRRAEGSAEYVTVAANLTDTSYTDANLQFGKSYGYIVVASNTAGESPSSAPAGAFAMSPGGQQSSEPPTPADTTAPAIPSNLAVAAGDATATITWTDPADSDLSTIKIYRGTVSGSLSLLTTVAAGTETSTNTPLTNGTTYYYALAATDSAGNESSQTSEASGTPQAPNLHLAIDTLTSDGIWTAPAGVSSVTVELWGAGGGGTQGVGAGGGGAYSRCDDVTVVPSTGYSVVVGTSAVNTNGGNSTFDTSTCVAKGGLSGTNGSTGGAAASGTGDTKFSGGNGRVSTVSSGAGGGSGTEEDGGSTTSEISGSAGDFFGGVGGSPSQVDSARAYGAGGGSSGSVQYTGAPGLARVTYSVQQDPDEPVVKARSWGRSGSDTTSHAVSLPADIEVGDLLLVVFSVDGNVTLTATAGWTVVQEVFTAQNTPTSAIIYKFATGSDSLTMTSSASDESVHVSMRIAGATSGPLIAASSGSTANTDPPAAGLGIEGPAYCIAIRAGDLNVGGQAAVTAPPAGYNDFLYPKNGS